MLNRRNLLAAATGAAALASVPSVRAQSGKIILGQSAPFTGPAAQLGIQYLAGARLYFESVNTAGGIGGRSVEIRSMDDGYEPVRTAENTKSLINDGVTALFGYIGTPTSLVALPMATDARVPFFAPFTGSMALRAPNNRHAFHIRASYQDETELIVKTLLNTTFNKVAVFYQNDSYGRAGLEGVTLALGKHGLEPMATATVERNSVDVSKAVDAILAKKPDAIVQITAYKSSAAFVRAARRKGYLGGVYNVSFVGTQALADELGPEGAGIVISQVMPSPYRKAYDISREFSDLIRKTNSDVNANFSSMEGYVAARVMTEGLRRSAARSISREGLIAGLESFRDVRFGGFSVDFTPGSRGASKFVELSMLTADGKVKT